MGNNNVKQLAGYERRAHLPINTQWFVSTYFALPSTVLGTYRQLIGSFNPYVNSVCQILETFGFKFRNTLIRQTIAQFMGNRDVALANSAPVLIIVLVEELNSRG